MKATQRAQPRLPTVTKDAKTVGSVKEKVSGELDKRYAIASTTNKKFGLITAVLGKNAKRVNALEESKQKQTQSNQQSAVQNTTLPAIASSFNIIISSLQRINGVLAKAAGVQSMPTDEAPTAKPIEQPKPAATKAPGLFDGLMSNPFFMVAALGLFYLGLPEEDKQKLKALLSGFIDGLWEGMDENSKNGLQAFNTGLKVAAGLVLFNFSVKFIGGAADAILKMIRAARFIGRGRVGVGMAVMGAGGVLAYEGIKDWLGGSGTAIDSLGNLSATGGEHKIGKDEAGSAKQAIDFFMSKGWSKEQAIGLAANIQAESNFKTNATGDSGKAYGLAQWHPDRQQRFQEIYGKDIRDAGFQEQLAFIDWELNNTEKGAGNRLRGATSPESAAAIVDQFYERSSGAHRQKRMDIASAYAKGIVPETTVAAAKPSSAAPPTSNPPQVAAAATAPTTSSAQPSPAMAKNIKAASEQVAQQKETEGDVFVKKVTNQTVGQTGDKKETGESDIPSPVANRGSLKSGSSHSTGYA